MPETAKEDLGLPGRRPSTNRGPGQLLADRLRSKWERERASKLQRLREQSQRQRDAEIRQLLQAKEAQLRQMQERLQKQRNDTIRQAWHLQRQLVEELLKGGSSRRERGIHQDRKSVV